MKMKVEAALSEEFLMDLENSPIPPFKNLIEKYELADPNYLTTFDKGTTHITYWTLNIH